MLARPHTGRANRAACSSKTAEAGKEHFTTGVAANRRVCYRSLACLRRLVSRTRIVCHAHLMDRACDRSAIGWRVAGHRCRVERQLKRISADVAAHYAGRAVDACRSVDRRDAHCRVPRIRKADARPPTRAADFEARQCWQRPQSGVVAVLIAVAKSLLRFSSKEFCTGDFRARAPKLLPGKELRFAPN
jgi:hypothetical protein